MRARLIKCEESTRQSSRETIQQNSPSHLEVQVPTLTGIAAIRTEIAARIITTERQKREQAREHFNNLFTQRP